MTAKIETTLNFQPPPITTPGNREGGVARCDTCVDAANAPGVTALVPYTNMGLTANPSPDLFVYMPPNNAETAELRIYDESTGQEVFAGEFTLPESPKGSAYAHKASIIKLPLETAAIALEPDKAYIWAISVVCDRSDRAQDIVVDVVVQRAHDPYLKTLPEDVTKQLETIDTASSEEQLLAYSHAGLWHDLLSKLSDLVESDATTYKAAWTQLLSSQEIAAIADAPVYQSTLTAIGD